MQNIKKVVVLGEKGAGKTAFIERIRTANFIQEYIPTQEITTSIFDLDVDDEQKSFEFVEVPETELDNVPQDGDVYIIVIDGSVDVPDGDEYPYCRYVPDDKLCRIVKNKADIAQRRRVHGDDYSVMTNLGFQLVEDSIFDLPIEDDYYYQDD